MGRYWGNRIKDNPSQWRQIAEQHKFRDVLIVDPEGKLLYRGRVFDPEKAPTP